MKTSRSCALRSILFLVALCSLERWSFAADCIADGNGVISYQASSSCSNRPDQYKLKIYKMGLCTAAPTPAAGTAADFSTCQTVFENSSGSMVLVQNGVSTALTGGTITRPTNGSYAYGYVVIEPEIQLQVNKTFDRNLFASAGVAPVVPSPGGTQCWTTLGTDFLWTNSSTRHYNCGSTAAADLLTLKLNSFDNTFFQSSQTNIATTNGNLNVYLVNANNQLAAGNSRDSMNDVSKLLGVQNVNVTVLASSTGMETSFKVSTGSTLIFGNTNDLQGISGGPFLVLVNLN